jgi:hypothetical protein
VGVVVRDTTLGGGRNYISNFEGSQAVPACPSGIGIFFIYILSRIVCITRDKWLHAVLDIANLFPFRSYTYIIHNYTITAICSITVTSAAGHFHPLDTTMDFNSLRRMLDYGFALLPDIVFTGVVRKRCQSCLLLLSNQRASARLGTAWRNTAGGGVYRVMRRPHHNIWFNLMSLEGVYYSKIFANVGRALLGRNFDVNNGRAAWKHTDTLPNNI